MKTLDEKLQMLAGKLQIVAEDWAEPSEGRTINHQSILAGVASLRQVADAALVALDEESR